MLANKLMSALSGGDEDKLYVDDVFSTYLYTGNQATQTINNGIDLAGKGGMVWLKSRSIGTAGTGDHFLSDTSRGTTSVLSTNTTGAAVLFKQPTSFDGAGFTLSSNTYGNTSAATYASWTFRKAPKFFDVVTYTGNGESSRAIAHSLGQEVGMVMTKATSTTGDWNTYHRSATGDLVLNTTAAQTGSKALVNSATTTTFTVSGAANTNAVTYVAYLFAHDTAADGLIWCGSFTTDGSGNFSVNLGFEPQFLLFKNSTGTADNWHTIDTMRGFNVSAVTQSLKPNLSNAEGVGYGVRPTSTGFDQGTAGNVLASSTTYIYLAIRRPNKPPTSGTEVYNAIARTGTSAIATVSGGQIADAVLIKNRGYAASCTFASRLTGSGYLVTSSTAKEGEASTTILQANAWDVMDGIKIGTSSNMVNVAGHTFVNYFFKRAPGFFDVVCDTGTGLVYAIAHSLTVVPELMIRKKRSTADNWVVYAGDATDYLILNGTAATADLDTMWNDTAPTASAFTVGTNDDVNQSAGTFVTYLFATKEGISKVGSYTGNGTTQTINCGFTTGARFILIKRTDAIGDWYIWDTARGIVSANDPHLSLNTVAKEVTTDDSVDPDASGFIVNQVAATNINVPGGSYIYFSVA